MASAATPAKKRIYLNFFDFFNAGNHMSPGQWLDPADKCYTKDRLPYWLNLARLAEEGKISFIFLADTYAGHEVYGGTLEPQLRSSAQSAVMDPFLVVPAMAAVTKTVGFGVTGSTSYLNPYILARSLSSLDHLTEGRVAWNVVTSWSQSTADALGASGVVAHDERYAIAQEYMDVCYKLWESSWSDDAVVRNIETRTAFDYHQIKRIQHEGKYLKTNAPHQTHPSPQRTPVLFQAGTSKQGRQFASKHAECVYIGGLVPSASAADVAAIRALAAAAGRDPASLKFFVGISPIIGKTLEEAQAKYERARQNADYIGGLSQFSGYTGIDLSRFPVDEVFDLKDAPNDMAVHGILNAFNKASGSDTQWTPRMLGEKMALGGLHPAPVGTPEMVADVFEEWIDGCDVDGFNISYTTSPGSFEDVVYLLRPELVKRGLMWEDYDVPGGTLRENLLGKGKGRLPEEHYGSRFKWGRGGEVMKEDGDVVKPHVNGAEASTVSAAGSTA
ncbi:putative dibenzothiophene desulfurization enzyme A [Coleophoma cylindrospora]|uniref:Putative dibenzothiophene desulfurization enzyme A n=1 Tax=Coleophoma cylindrospora TaxID=1849047 RepID=A0A3D8S8I4_9HELO|nr:putative dibenzothiophene desulfurization enzyme A [Coleophoma cylindrospora]